METEGSLLCSQEPATSPTHLNFAASPTNMNMTSGLVTENVSVVFFIIYCFNHHATNFHGIYYIRYSINYLFLSFFFNPPILLLQWNNKSNYEIYIPCSLYQVGLLTLLNAHWFSTRFLSCEIFYDWLIDFDGVRLRLWTAVTTGHIVRPPDHMSLESDDGIILTGRNRRTRRKTCPSATLSTTNPTWIDPGANPGLPGERPETNRLKNGTAQSSMKMTHKPLSITICSAENKMCLFPLLCVNMLWPDLWTVQQCFSRTN
jgi:hypothetical protein